jgi:hypothetical protein
MLRGGGDRMKASAVLLFASLCISCEYMGFEPLQTSSLIIANVHWQDQGVPDIPVVLVQTGDTVRTASNGLAIFSVPAGHYVVRAFGINRGGPVLQFIDFDVEARPGAVAVVDIIDCLPCD